MIRLVQKKAYTSAVSSTWKISIPGALEYEFEMATLAWSFNNGEAKERFITYVQSSYQQLFAPRL